MAKRFLIVAGTVAALCISAGSAHAQGSITPFAGAVFGGDVPSSRATYGVSLVGNSGPLGAEFEFGYTPTLFDSEVGSANLTTLMGNILVGLPLGVFHPYGSAGLGLMRQRTTANPVTLLNDITDNDFGYSVGGGAWTMLSPNVGIRGDVRFFQVRKTGGFNFGRAYGGLLLAF